MPLGSGGFTTTHRKVDLLVGACKYQPESESNSVGLCEGTACCDQRHSNRYCPSSTTRKANQLQVQVISGCGFVTFQVLGVMSNLRLCFTYRSLKST
jgi:hypothetical protein